MRLKLLALLATAFATSAGAAPLTEVGSAPIGATGGAWVAAQGRYTYVAHPEQNAIIVFDAATPSAPVEVGRLTGTWGDLAIRSRYLYVGGLTIVDILNPAAPVVVGQLTIAGARTVTVSSNWAYVATATGLSIVDVSDPAAPIEVGWLATPAQVMDVAISEPASTACTYDTFAYLATLDGALRIVNVSNPAQPREVGSLGLAWGEARGVATAGSYVYATSFVRDDEFGDPGPGKFHVVDVSNPAAPRLVASRQQNKASHEIVLSGGFAYVMEYSTGYNGTYAELAVVDIRNPLALAEVARNATSRAYDVALSGGYVFVPLYAAPTRLAVYREYRP